MIFSQIQVGYRMLFRLRTFQPTLVYHNKHLLMEQLAGYLQSVINRPFEICTQQSLFPENCNFQFSVFADCDFEQPTGL